MQLLNVLRICSDKWQGDVIYGRSLQQIFKLWVKERLLEVCLWRSEVPWLKQLAMWRYCYFCLKLDEMEWNWMASPSLLSLTQASWGFIFSKRSLIIIMFLQRDWTGVLSLLCEFSGRPLNRSCLGSNKDSWYTVLGSLLDPHESASAESVP